MKKLVYRWFEAWNTGNLEKLPISDTFSHTSPFGTIEGKKAYLELVDANKAKFLGYEFKILDAIYETDKACVRYRATQGSDFSLDVSEWYYKKGELISKVIAYYHIGEIRDERTLKS